jgi:hypothetical protein
MKTCSTLLASLALVVFGSGCAESHGNQHAGHDHEHHDHGSACVYDPEKGIRLSPKAAVFIGLEASEFTGRLPATALLRTVKGDFVFAGQGGWFRRTPVQIRGSDAGGYEVLTGLEPGRLIAMRGANALWLAELQAVNGGVGCADGH